MRTYRFVLTGLGNVGRNFLAILLSHKARLQAQYGLELQAVGVADSSGGYYAADGLDLDPIVARKQAGRGVAELAPAEQQGLDALSLVQQLEADFLLEATPTNLVDGQPALEITRTALRRGMHAVLGSKGPLVLAYQELAAMSDLATAGLPALRFSGAVGGALPTINIGRRDLAGGRINRVEAVLNGTTQIILGLMTQGQSYEAALAQAQEVGIAEPDPSLDVEGWDAANKLVILANAVLNIPVTLADVSVTGIRNVTVGALQAAQAAGGRLSLLAVAERRLESTDTRPAYRLEVAPVALPADHPLARLALDEMGVVYYSDIYGRMAAANAERGPVGAAAAMLRDVIEITTTRGR